MPTRHRNRLLHYPRHLHHRLFVSSALGRRHCLLHQRHHYPPSLPPPSLPSLPPPSPSASASTLASSIASATIAACALATTAATAALATITFASAHATTTVPTAPYPYRPTAPQPAAFLRRLLLTCRGPRAGYSS